jgi:hypothetical protein
VNSHLKVGVQAQNLLKAKTYIDVGPASLHPRYAWKNPTATSPSWFARF